MFFVIVLSALALTQAGIRCVDDNGCVRPHCQTFDFGNSYDRIIQAQQQATGATCRI